MDYYKTDAEFMERFDAFRNQEVVSEESVKLDEKTRYMAILATLLGCQGIEEYKEVLAEALKGAVTPVEVKEIVYQAVDYLGIGRVKEFLKVTNEIMTAAGIEPAITKAGHNNDGRSSGKRCAGTGRYIW